MRQTNEPSHPTNFFAQLNEILLAQKTLYWFLMRYLVTDNLDPFEPTAIRIEVCWFFFVLPSQHNLKAIELYVHKHII